MKPNVKREKKAMIEEIMPALQLRPGTDTYKTVSKDLEKLRHFTLFTMRQHYATRKGK